MVRKLLLASVGAIAFTGTAAFAADLPSRAPPPVYLPPAPIFTWTGIYVGGQVGYGWGNDNTSLSGFDPKNGALGASASGAPSGVIGGAHVGYNYQIQQWVLGLEGDVNGTSLSDNGSNLYGTSNLSTNVQGSIRGRVGVAWDRALIYATGGAAFGGFNSNIALPAFATGTTSSTRVGWTVGGGIEYAITNNWSIRAEYRYTDFGTINGGLPTLNGGFMNGSHRYTQNQVQVGFSYKFDMFNPAPVVAKY